MLKNININKKLIIVLLLINILIIGTSYSYALFETTFIKTNTIKLQAGNTDITTAIENYSNNTITLNGNESKTINVTLSNITNYNILYKMYYIITSGSGTVMVTEGTASPSGTMNNNKTFSLTIKNNNSSALTIKINTKGALINSSITLNTNEYELIKDTTPPSITNVKDAGNGKIIFTATDNESGVDKYCINQSSTSTTNCNWINAISGIQTTEVITSTSGTYYVHVKDLAGNIANSSAVALSIGINASEFVTSKVVSYSTASASDFSGGLVAINNSGDLYNNSGTIREYRYIGLNVNNYIFLDTNGNNQQDTNEKWRIVGIFKNSNNQWNYKLMRDTTLTSDEMPTSYSHNGTTFTIKIDSTSKYVYFNSTKTGTEYNDFSTAGLQYWLNDSNSGYFSTLSSIIKSKVDTNYTYYLGNWSYTSNLRAGTSYTYERNASNTHSGNPATWSGAVALLYPSDFGYSASSSRWADVLYNYNSGYNTSSSNTSWMCKTQSYSEWLISPYSSNFDDFVYWNSTASNLNAINHSSASSGVNNTARPVINLLSTATFKDNGADGSINNPYVLN